MLEDIGLMRGLPNMKVMCTSDDIQTRWAVEKIAEIEGPVYLRLCRLATPVIYNENQKFEFGKAVQIGDGEDAAVFATGVTVSEAIKAQESSRALFSGAAHADMPTTEIEEADLTDGVIDLISLLVKAELAPTRSEARRNIEQGGVTVDGEKVSDVKATFTKDALAGDGMVIKRGKKKFKKVVLK